MAPTSIILITGFLGAGKTTVMQHLLTSLKTDTALGSDDSDDSDSRDNSDTASQTPKIGLIVNEFGKISIDGPVLQQSGVEITELNNGSIFCKCLSGTFVDSIAAMLSYHLDYLFIESSGLSDPSNMQDILTHVKNKTDQPYTYAGVLCVVDAKYFRKLSQTLSTITRQILASTLVVVNKADLVSDEELESVKRSIKRLNPLARISTTTYGRIDLAELQKLRRSRLGSHLPSLNTPETRPKTLLILTSDRLERSRLMQFIEILQDRVYRLKGLVRLVEGSWHLDVVGGEVSLEANDLQFDRSELVIIPRPGLNLRDEVQTLLRDVLQIEADLE